jgi:hypothetical protein
MAGDSAARVGAVQIPVDSLARIAAAQQISPALARDAAVHDALLASEARARGLDEVPAVRAEMSVVLARSLLQRLLEEARSAGPVTDEELRTATERHWLDLDRPEGFRTVHAVVRLKEGADAVTRARANEVAEAIRAAVSSARDVALTTAAPPPTPGKPPPADPAAEAFEQAANAVPKQGFEVLAQPLPPVAASGRLLTSEGQRFDTDFSRAAASLVTRGDLSAPVASAFGVHVILLLERIPSQTVPEEERRRLVLEEVVSDRARAAQARLIESLRREPRLVDGLDALLELVRIEP